MNATCPQEHLHADEPTGYIAWHDWAATRDARGSRQKRCAGCGLYKIWTPLTARHTPPANDRSRP